MKHSLLTDDDYYPLIEARHCDPFRILGIRRVDERWVARIFRPDVRAVSLILDANPSKKHSLAPADGNGLFESILGDFKEGWGYQLELTAHDGSVWRVI